MVVWGHGEVGLPGTQDPCPLMRLKVLAEALTMRPRNVGVWGSSHHTLSRSDPGPLSSEMVRAPGEKPRSTVHRVNGEG